MSDTGTVKTGVKRAAVQATVALGGLQQRVGSRFPRYARFWRRAARVAAYAMAGEPFAPSPAPLTRREQGFVWSIDRCNAEGVFGWAVHPSGVREVRVDVNGRSFGRAVLGLPRGDVVQALGGIPYGANPGFVLAFPDGSLDGLDGQVAVLIEVEAADGTRASESRRIFPLRVSASNHVAPAGSRDRLAPLPHDVLEVLRRIDPVAYATRGSWDEGLVRRAVDHVVELVRQRTPAKPVSRYALYLTSMAAAFGFIGEHFERLNRLSDLSLKDSASAATTPEEMLCIAHHLYVLKSHGVDGGLVECGCFKGFSSCCLSQACAALGIHMDVFDSFAGLPRSGSSYYQEGDFCGTLDEVTDNLRAFGRPEVVTLHRGFFSESMPGYDRPIMCLWMDVDLTSSAADVMTVLPRLAAEGCVFTHECPGDAAFVEGRPVPESAIVLPPIVEAYERLGRDPGGAYLAGALGVVLDPSRALPVLGLDAIRRIVDAAAVSS